MPQQSREQDFSKGFQKSLFAHGALLMILFVKATVFPDQPIAYFPTLRVDLVALPDVLKKDLAKQPLLGEISQIQKETKITTTRDNKKSEKALPEEMVYKPKELSPSHSSSARRKKMKGALDRIKSLNKILAEVEVQPPSVIKGNKISKGSSLSGEAREAQFANFYDTLRDHLQLNWALPVWIARQNYSAKIQIYIDNRGRLHHFKFLKLSGNSQFDEAVKRTLLESDPYPAPPADLGRSLLMDGILVGFPL